LFDEGLDVLAFSFAADAVGLWQRVGVAPSAAFLGPGETRATI
jgi:hypothetical protein